MPQQEAPRVDRVVCGEDLNIFRLHVIKDNLDIYTCLDLAHYYR